MRKISAFSVVFPLALMSLASCGKGGDDPAARSDGWSIAAGVYSNVADGTERGFEVALPAGDQSRTGQFRRCVAADCSDAMGFTARRGLNGLSFSYSDAGRSVDVTITPASPTDVMVSGDWGKGLETAILPKVDKETL